MADMALGRAERGPAPGAARWDRDFFLALVLAVWVGIVLGFGGDIAGHLRAHGMDYPLIVHVHAAALVGWLVLSVRSAWWPRPSRAARNSDRSL